MIFSLLPGAHLLRRSMRSCSKRRMPRAKPGARWIYRRARASPPTKVPCGSGPRRPRHLAARRI